MRLPTLGIFWVRVASLGAVCSAWTLTRRGSTATLSAKLLSAKALRRRPQCLLWAERDLSPGVTRITTTTVVETTTTTTTTTTEVVETTTTETLSSTKKETTASSSSKTTTAVEPPPPLAATAAVAAVLPEAGAGASFSGGGADVRESGRGDAVVAARGLSEGVSDDAVGTERRSADDGRKRAVVESALSDIKGRMETTGWKHWDDRTVRKVVDDRKRAFDDEEAGGPAVAQRKEAWAAATAAKVAQNGGGGGGLASVVERLRRGEDSKGGSEQKAGGFGAANSAGQERADVAEKRTTGNAPPSSSAAPSSPGFGFGFKAGSAERGSGAPVKDAAEAAGSYQGEEEERTGWLH